MVAWPSSLPRPILERSLSAGPVDAVARFEVDEGPSMRRRRWTDARQSYRMTIRLSPSEWDSLNDFLSDDLDDGDELLDLPDPVPVAAGSTASTLSLRLLRPVTKKRTGAYWDVTLNFEEVP